MSESRVSVAPTPEITTRDSAAEDLNALFLSGSNIVKRVANTMRRVHTAAEELQILQSLESRANEFHADILSTLRFRRNQLTQINCLPDEILLMIFLYAENDNISREMLRYLPLTWICRRWRFLAMNSPDLWKLLDYSCQNFEALEEISRRSKGSKVWVGLLGRRHGSSSSPGIMGWSQNYPSYLNRSELHFGNFKRLIIPILSRVEVLHLDVRECHPRDALLSLQENLCPSIRRCQLYMYGTKSESVLAELVFSKIFNSQALEVLEIYSDHLSFSRIAVEPQVPNLRYLVLMSKTSAPDLPAVEDLLRILQSCCSSLETLELATLCTRSSTPLLHPKIDMTRLTTIELLNHAQIMEYLSTPALEMLVLNGRYMSQISPLAYFENLPIMRVGHTYVQGYKDINGSHELCFKMDLPIRGGHANELQMLELAPHFSKWAGHLSSLEIEKCAIGGASSVQLLLKHAHMLRNLRLDFDCEEIFPLLEDPATCPQLESFTYTCWEGKPGKRLLSVVRLRHKSGTPLKHLTLSAKQPVARTHAEKLKELVDFTLHSVI